MKKLIFAAAVLFSCLSIQIANAQVKISLGLNIGSQPDWGPVGYDHADYYYMPDIDTYYDVTNHVYVYNEGGVWVHRAYLPVRYQNYDRYHGYKVVVNERNPWEREAEIRARYAAYKGRRDQAVIRDSREAKYRMHYREQVARNKQQSKLNAYHARKNVSVAKHNAAVAKHNSAVAHRNAQVEKRIHQQEKKQHHN